MSEPENLVLTQLREIRATLTEHDARFDQLAQTLSEMQTQLVGIGQLLITLHGMHNEGAQRLARLEARVDRLEKLAESP